MRVLKPSLVVLVLALGLCAGAVPAGADEPIEQFGALIESGHLAMDVLLHPGGMPLGGGRRLVIEGAPVLRMDIDAAEGRLTRLSGRLSGGEVVIESPGLIPDVVLEEVEVDSTGTIVTARFRGKSFLGNVLVSLVREMAMKAVRRLKFSTAIIDLAQGRLVDDGSMGSRARATGRPESVAAADAEVKAAAPPKEPSVMDLIEEVCFQDSVLRAFPDRRLSLGGNLEITTDEDPATHQFLTVRIASLRWRPARGGKAADLVVTGSLDGRVKDGKLIFETGLLAFQGGLLTDARFAVFTTPGGIASRVTGEALHLDLSRGDMTVPGGVRVALESGVLDLTKFVTEPSGELTGLIAFVLRGATGTVRRKGEAVALSNVIVQSEGLELDHNRATGPLAVDFAYRLVHPFSVSYPVPELAARTVPLLFEGPMSLRLRLEGVGAGDEGSVAGTYFFDVPWAPVERAAFEVARARWTQDIAKLVKKVSFEVDPLEFRPCGDGCFGARFHLVAQKLSASGKPIFTEKCEPEFRAGIVVDKEDRAFVLAGLNIHPRCEGVAGWIVNFLTPFFTKSYENMTIFRMPAGLPFTVDTVKASETTVRIAGAVSWEVTGN